MWLVVPIIALMGTLGLAPADPATQSVSGARDRVTHSRDCYDDTFCIESVEEEDQVDLYVSKLVPWDFTLVVDLKLENMQSDRDLPLIRSFAARGREQILKLRIMQPGRRWSYHFDLRWVVGALDAKHDDDYVYSLPFGRGESFLVAQGYGGMASHEGKNALDFDMPAGTGVRAARDGVVVEVEESNFRGGLDPGLRSRANFVKIRHSDGTIGHYVHLMQNGVRVYVGDRVRKGDLIAYSGDTGYSSGPHLHFEVYTISRSLKPETIPVRFRANGRNAVELREGNVYGH
jgi:murein DD-endopeptidase MepM/ murein hydrolase activator NlpD